MGKKGWVAVESFKWRAFAKNESFRVRCGGCGHVRLLPGSVVEAYREAGSPSGRMIQAGTSMQTLGMNQNPKMAAAAAAQNMMCPSCGSIAPQVFRG